MPYAFSLYADAIKEQAGAGDTGVLVGRHPGLANYIAFNALTRHFHFTSSVSSDFGQHPSDLVPAIHSFKLVVPSGVMGEQTSQCRERSTRLMAQSFCFSSSSYMHVERGRRRLL